MASLARQERDSQVGFWVFRMFMFTSPFFFFSDKKFSLFLMILQIDMLLYRILAYSTERVWTTFSKLRFSYMTTANCKQPT